MASTAQRGLRAAFSSSNPTKIILGGVPSHATPGDVRRAILQAGIQGCSEVSLMYDHGKPTGQALLGLSTPEYCREARNVARTLNLYGSDLTADYADDKPQNNKPGYGPAASTEPQTSVLITGLPYIAPFRQLKMKLLHGFELAKVANPISQVAIPEQMYQMHSRVLVRLANPAEAHRLVRRIHLTTYGDNPSPIRAEILY
ncbi:hypothetical protein CVT24_010408 [Panaeolus cyanescens]|uniref:RRM domain-containing protein n=1 Tax=Panaeolus cyanescens TaxID=181874 RepID=A0A409YPM3_9AGAR|nr:hypothetical protein CVT24_010408 [Panaeolus cyanescens]